MKTLTIDNKKPFSFLNSSSNTIPSFSVWHDIPICKRPISNYQQLKICNSISTIAGCVPLQIINTPRARTNNTVSSPTQPSLGFFFNSFTYFRESNANACFFIVNISPTCAFIVNYLHTHIPFAET